MKNLLFGFVTFRFFVWFWGFLVCCVGFLGVLCVLYLILAVLLGELNGDIVLADAETPILVLVGASGVVGLEELDEGESLDSAEVRAAAVHILGNVDVADRAVLLEHRLQVRDGDVTGQVAGDDGLDARGKRGHGGLWAALERGTRALLSAATAGGRRRNNLLGLLNVCPEGSLSTAVRRVVKNPRDVAPGEASVPEVPHNGVVQQHTLELGTAVRDGVGDGSHLGRAWKGLEGLEG